MFRKYREIPWTPEQRVFLALGGAHIVSVVLFLARSADASNPRYWFLLWNAFLGALPLGFAWWLHVRLQQGKKWKSWLSGIISLLWISFLPNSFYIVSDLIHLHQTGEVSLLYDAVLFTSFIINGMIAGFISVFLVHKHLLARMPSVITHIIVACVFLASGFAIYLGRFFRWNSWDIFLHPAAVLFDVSSQFISPASQGIFGTTLSIFLLLSSAYVVIWQLVRLIAYKK